MVRSSSTNPSILGSSVTITSTSIAPVNVTTSSASDAPGLITLTGGGGGAGFRILPIGGATKYNWEFSSQVIADNAFGITPSTAPGGSTFSTSALSIAGATGAVSIPGTLSIGNPVTAGIAVASTSRIAIVIGGTTYYLLATTVA